MDRAELTSELKRMIVEECERDIDPQQIDDDEQLIGTGGRLELDSLDALQIALAVKQRYGKRIDGNNKTRAALQSVNTLADFIQA